MASPVARLRWWLADRLRPNVWPSTAAQHAGLLSENKELALRLADAAQLVADVGQMLEDDLAPLEDPGAFLSVLDHALRGDPGCVEPAENDQRRAIALDQQQEYLGL